jgi:hypothetical protein
MRWWAGVALAAGTVRAEDRDPNASARLIPATDGLPLRVGQVCRHALEDQPARPFVGKRRWANCVRQQTTS